MQPYGVSMALFSVNICKNKYNSDLGIHSGFSVIQIHVVLAKKTKSKKFQWDET